MRLVEVQWDPSDRQLLQFAWIGGLALPILGWFWGIEGNWIWGLLGISVAIVLIGSLVPKCLKPAFIGLTLITVPLGMVIGEIGLLMIYFGVFLPIGCCLRWFGRDSLQLRRNRNATSYWQNKPSPKDTESYFRRY